MGLIPLSIEIRGPFVFCQKPTTEVCNRNVNDLARTAAAGIVRQSYRGLALTSSVALFMRRPVQQK